MGPRIDLKKVSEKKYPSASEYTRLAGKSTFRCQFGEETKDWCGEKYTKWECIHQCWFCKDHWMMFTNELWRKSRKGEKNGKVLESN